MVKSQIGKRKQVNVTKIKAVLFDLGNTLFKFGKEEDWDWVGIHKEAFIRLALI